jgi:hypothetical protein
MSTKLNFINAWKESNSFSLEDLEDIWVEAEFMKSIGYNGTAFELANEIAMFQYQSYMDDAEKRYAHSAQPWYDEISNDISDMPWLSEL